MQTWSDLTWPASDFSRVPYGVYLSQDVYEREQERIFHGPVWNFLALDAEIPNSGDFKTTYVGDTPVAVNRAEDGSIHAFVNSCAHRGSMVVREPFGNRATHTCIYHHWCYDLRGRLIGVPFQRGVDGKGGMPDSFDKGQHGLRTLEVATYRGVVFATFDRNAESLEDFLGETALAALDRKFRKPIEILGYMRQRLICNWKLYRENVNDGYHGGLLHLLPLAYGIHRLTQEGAMSLDAEARHNHYYAVVDTDTPELIAEGYAGTEREAQIEHPLKLEDPSFLDWRDEVGDGRVLEGLSIFPNVLFSQMNNVLMTEQVRTSGPDEFELHYTHFGYTDDDPELRAMRLWQANLRGPAGFINMEDGEAPVLIQKGIRRQADRHTVIEMGGLGPIVSDDHIVTEVPVRGFWRYYCKLMGIEVAGEAA